MAVSGRNAIRMGFGIHLQPKGHSGLISPILSGDGKTYSYAMYYVATRRSSQGDNNSIGVAFSNDGISLEEISSTDHLSGNADGPMA